VMQRFNRLVVAVGKTPPAPHRDEAIDARPATRPSSGVVRRAPSKPRSLSPRTKPSRPRLSKREANRRARRQEDLIKLVFLVLGFLTYPLWGPSVIAMFTNAILP
jgi:hypothetical protein